MSCGMPRWRAWRRWFLVFVLAEPSPAVSTQARRRFVLTRLSREAGRPVDQGTTVMDLSGLGLKHLTPETIRFLRRISEIFQDNYAGMTCSLLLVNAPWVFDRAWRIVEGERVS